MISLFVYTQSHYMLHDMIIMEYAYHTQWGISSKGRAPA